MLTADRIEKQDRYYAMAATMVVVALILLFLILKMIITPIPPFEEKPGGGGGMMGVEMAWGNGLTGSGESIGEKQGTKTDAKSQANTPQEQSSESVVVGDNQEESVSIKKDNKKNNHKKDKKVVKDKKEKIVDVEPKPSSELQEMLDKMREKTAITEGGHGPDGTDGSIGSKDGKDGGPGTGGGVGGGDGKGVGQHKGPGIGSGFIADVGDRTVIKRPNLSDDSGEEGKVVVDVVVDKEGRVIKASPGARGTTLTHNVLWAKARQAALSTQFKPSDKGIKEQRGTITFVFLRR